MPFVRRTVIKVQKDRQVAGARPSSESRSLAAIWGGGRRGVATWSLDTREARGEKTPPVSLINYRSGHLASALFGDTESTERGSEREERMSGGGKAIPFSSKRNKRKRGSQVVPGMIYWGFQKQ
ncbi:hypothetical protein AAFF_G00254810 [Aldrovandia affinis]|uniref:Uncharacterized protein n=1 Tax=Aldrovandia affinis TaxID=143900 RepID=A0AAD7RD25_9TELE|nr:hypothetical protein AAFF_G00254810 [Aldrovandia affinis]